jgi:hypothetical protein
MAPGVPSIDKFAEGFENQEGHRLRVAIAGHDKDNFARIPANGTPVITAPRNRQHASFIELPIIP